MSFVSVIVIGVIVSLVVMKKIWDLFLSVVLVGFIIIDVVNM